MSISVSDLRAELAELEAQLRLDPRHKKIEHLKALIQLYGDSSEATSVKTGLDDTMSLGEVEAAVDDLTFASTNAAKAFDFDRTPKIVRIKSALEEVLQNGQSVHRKNLLEALKSKGLMGSEKDPMAAFASNMYQLRDVFESDGKGMFRLRRKDSGPNTTLERLRSLVE